MKHTHKLLSAVLLLMAVAVMMGCSNSGGNKGNLAEKASGNMEAYESGNVNAIEQARPSIMVIPGDQTLQNFKI